MPGNRRRERFETALLGAGIASVTAILVSYFALHKQPDAVEIISWSGATTCLMIVLRVYQRVTAVRWETIVRLNKRLSGTPETRKCAACDFTDNWFTVLLHEGAVHGL